MKKSIFLLLGALWIFSACVTNQNTHLSSLQKADILLSSGEQIETFLAMNTSEQARGLSGIPSDEFTSSQGMLFVYPDIGKRGFWMPDTYFDLDIFFLDEDFTVIHISRDMPHHPGKQQSPPIASTEQILCRYALEMRSDSRIAKKIQIGDTLRIEWE